MKDATAEIAAGLTAVDRHRRRRDSIGATYHRSAEVDEMRRLHKSDPARFAEVYGPRGDLVLGMADQARDALAEDDPDPDPEAA